MAVQLIYSLYALLYRISDVDIYKQCRYIPLGFYPVRGFLPLYTQEEEVAVFSFYFYTGNIAGHLIGNYDLSFLRTVKQICRGLNSGSGIAEISRIAFLRQKYLKPA